MFYRVPIDLRFFHVTQKVLVIEFICPTERPLRGPSSHTEATRVSVRKEEALNATKARYRRNLLTNQITGLCQNRVIPCVTFSYSITNFLYVKPLSSSLYCKGLLIKKLLKNLLKQTSEVVLLTYICTHKELGKNTGIQDPFLP